jgi:glycosyltransferase involved in cell wall biosynthesis
LWSVKLNLMRILVLSFYYPPDIGPGALRAKSIVDALVKEGPPDLKVDVITTMPNRYSSFKVLSESYEKSDKISIKRVSLPKNTNGIFHQIKAFVFYCFSVQKLIFKKKWDIVLSTSGRLMTASLGAWVAKQTNSKLYLDIRDLFVDIMGEILKKKKLGIVNPFLCILEKWTFQSANKINLISPGFTDYFLKFKLNFSPSIFTHGVDKLFINNNFLVKQKNLKPLVLYAGNIGAGQGLHTVIPSIANKFKNLKFKIIGDGSAQKKLKNNNLFKLQNNIILVKPSQRKNLIKEYQQADILFLHLNDFKAFQKVLPSKIFEYAATGKPILAGVSGYAAKFLKNNVKGVEIFNPGDISGMNKGLKKLLNGPKVFNRKDFCINYDRMKIMKHLAKDILSI